MGTRAIVGPKFMPACVRGYANRRPGIFYTSYVDLCAISCGLGLSMVSSFVRLVIRLDTFGVQALLFGRSLCQHASRAMPIGARGFFTQCMSTYVNIVHFGVNNGVKFC